MLVTGGSSGLGLVMSEGLLQNGASVIIASRKQARIEEALENLQKLGDANGVAADISTAEGRQTLVQFVESQWGGLDVLINNAGTNYAAQLSDYSDEAFQKVVSTNLSSVFSLTRELTPLLEKSGRDNNPARIVNIGSMDGIHVPIVQRQPTFAYSASKAALHHLTKSFAIFLANKNITANAVAPGFFVSRMTEGVFESYLEDIEKDCPLRRLGKPAEIFGIIAYLITAAGAYTNGTTISVDGGASISKGYREWLN